MLLSEILGVDLDTDFGVEGYYGKFRVRVNTGYEFFVVSDGKGAYDTVVNGATVYDIIAAAPAGIIHLPLPLTDDQRDILNAYLKIGYRWMTKDECGVVSVWENKPEKRGGYWTVFVGDISGLLPECQRKISPIVSLCDPLDIAKALEIKR